LGGEKTEEKDGRTYYRADTQELAEGRGKRIPSREKKQDETTKERCQRQRRTRGY